MNKKCFDSSLEDIKIVFIIKYLEMHNWKLFHNKKNYIKIFQKIIDGKMFQVTIPLDRTLSDYNYTIKNFIKTIATIEGKAFEQVLLYFSNPYNDILKIRLENKNVEKGYVMLNDAVRLYNSAKKILAAAAMDEISPSIEHHGRPNDATNKFLAECKIGQSEIGSYIVPIICPIQKANNSEEIYIFPDDEFELIKNSLTHRVTDRIINNICIIKQHIDNNEFEDFVGNVSCDELISINFYEALDELDFEDNDINVEFITEWSYALQNDGLENKKVTFSKPYFKHIKNAIGKLKAGTLEKNNTEMIIGRIEALKSTPDAQTRESGIVTIVYIDKNQKKKTVNVNLDNDDYKKAIDAHLLGSYVRVVGEWDNDKKLKCNSFSIA